MDPAKAQKYVALGTLACLTVSAGWYAYLNRSHLKEAVAAPPSEARRDTNHRKLTITTGAGPAPTADEITPKDKIIHKAPDSYGSLAPGGKPLEIAEEHEKQKVIDAQEAERFARAVSEERRQNAAAETTAETEEMEPMDVDNAANFMPAAEDCIDQWSSDSEAENDLDEAMAEAHSVDDEDMSETPSDSEDEAGSIGHVHVLGPEVELPGAGWAGEGVSGEDAQKP
jgi:hypothetical protein